MDKRLEDVIALLALTAVDVEKLSGEMGTFEKVIKRRRANPSYSEKFSAQTDDDVAREAFSPEGYIAYTRCCTLLSLVEKLTHPTQSLTGQPKSDTTVIDREKVARNALEALTPAERTIQMHRYCRDCGKELTHHEHFCESVKF